MIAFGLAHALLIGAFVAIGIERSRVPVVAAVTVAAGAAIGAWLLPEVPADLQPLIVGYMLLISAMVVCAWTTRGGPARGMLTVAATLFYISDIFVARWRFVSPGPENALLCYPLYYAACLLFALATVDGHSRESSTNRSR